MSTPNKSLDKNKRYAGVKTNDFVNKTRTNEANRSAARPQGWANLGKINSRRIPPPANLPSLKSETGTNQPAFDPTIQVNHGWTSNESQSPLNTIPNPTQQQLDSLPVNCSTPPPLSSDIDKPRVPPTWSTITAGSNEQQPPPPNLLALNDFPRLATTAQDRKSQPDLISSIQSPSFRPANLAIWKEGGGSRVQPISNDLSQILPNNTGANLFQQQQQQNMRMYPPQMWAYNPYTPVPLTMHQQRVNTLNDYKNPTILRNKDIDDLSKLTDNTWANSSQEVNYEEKIRFSDDEDVEILDSNNKPRRMNSHVLKQKQQQPQHTRFIQDDEYLKQMQDNKNSELINTLTIAKQRRDEQERHLRNKTYDEQLISNTDDSKPIPGYQTRPLLTSNEQDSSSSWQTNREIPNTSRSRHDTANSQTFAMRSWSDQMDSFNYSSLHEKSGGRGENDEPSVPNKYSRSPSESSNHSHHDNGSRVTKSKKVPLSSNKQQQQKSNFIQAKTSSNKPNKVDETNYYDNNNNQQINSNDQWDNWDESTKQSIDNRYQQYPNDNRRRQQQQQQQIHSDDLSTAQKSNRYNEQSNNRNKQSLVKTRNNDRQQTNSRSKQNSSLTNKNQSVDNKASNNKTQPAWRPLSPNRPIAESADPTPQEAISFKSQQQQQQQQQRTGLNDHKQRYQTSNSPIINTALIPPLMSVRSDVTTTAKLYKTSNHTGTSHYSQRNDFYNETNDDDYYDEDTGYYDSNLQTHQRYHQSNLHNRGYTTLGSYGRYRRGGTLRHQQQYTTYNTNNTSGISSAPPTTTGTRNKKNSTSRTSINNKKVNESSEQSKPAVVDEIISPSVKKSSTTEELLITKPIETSVSSPLPLPATPEEVSTTTEIVKTNDNGNGISDQKSSIKNENETTVISQTENESTKINKKNPTSNAKRRTNKDQQTYHQDQRYQNQQAPRHRNTYARSMQEYEAMQMAATQNYYGTTRRSTHSGRNTHMHDVSSGYYYEHPQQHYNNRYNYSNEHYQQQQQQQQQQQPARSTNKTSKRGGSSTLNNRQQKQPIINGINNNNNNIRHHSISDNDLKEGEEWETASESSTNMRNGHYDNSGINNQQKNETKSMNRGRTPPKKSFSSQRPNARQIFKYTNA